MPPVPPSSTFDQLVWNHSMPRWPCLDGFVSNNEKRIEVSMVGDQETTRNWSDFVLKSEATWQCLQTHEHQILHRAAPAILKLHSAYFPGRWTRTAEDLLSEMSLRLACFYDDGSVHLWFSGTAIFNLLDIDVALDPDLRIEEVRFDG